jgi:hypothetical protein
VGPSAGLDTVVKRKNSRSVPGLEHPIIQPVAQRFTVELRRLLIRPVHYILAENSEGKREMGRLKIR